MSSIAFGPGMIVITDSDQTGRWRRTCLPARDCILEVLDEGPPFEVCIIHPPSGRTWTVRQARRWAPAGSLPLTVGDLEISFASAVKGEHYTLEVTGE